MSASSGALYSSVSRVLLNIKALATLLTYAITVFPVAELKVNRDVDFKTTPLSTDPPDFKDWTDK
jgi:hypothetical protein